jgi:hypothetical protein
MSAEERYLPCAWTKFLQLMTPHVPGLPNNPVWVFRTGVPKSRVEAEQITDATGETFLGIDDKNADGSGLGGGPEGKLSRCGHTLSELTRRT